MKGAPLRFEQNFRAGECNLSISYEGMCQCFGCDFFNIKRVCVYVCGCVFQVCSRNERMCDGLTMR